MSTLQSGRVGGNPRVSVVIVNYNGGVLLAKCVDSVRKNTRDYEIILVDNASTDDSLDGLRGGSDLRVLKLSRNFGFARANNVGIRASSGPYIVLLNCDTLVTPSWAERLVAKAEQSPAIGLVAPKLLRPGYPSILDSTGHIYQYQTGICVDRGSGEEDRGQYDHSNELLSCGFACVLIKRAVLDDIGLLDEKMFFYFEDVDFCLRARIAGMHVLYCPDSVVYHVRSASTPTWQRKQMGDQSRAYALRTFLKNYEFKNAIQYAGKWYVLDSLRVIAGIKNRDPKYVRFYGQPIIWNVLHFPLRERVHSQRLRKVPDRLIFNEEELRTEREVRSKFTC